MVERFNIELVIFKDNTWPMIGTSVRVFDNRSLQAVYRLVRAGCFGFVGLGRYHFQITWEDGSSQLLSLFFQKSEKKRYLDRAVTFSELTGLFHHYRKLRRALDASGNQKPIL